MGDWFQNLQKSAFIFHIYIVIKYIHTYVDMGTYMHSYMHTYKNISHAAQEPKRINPEFNINT